MASLADTFRNLPDLQTPRLLLRRMRLDDAADLYAYASDSEVTRYATWDTHTSIESSQAFLHFVVNGYAAGASGAWAIVHKDSGRMIGTAGFGSWDEPAGLAEIGYALARDFWGQGLTPEAVAAILRFGFENLGLNRIQARGDARNTASARVLEKCGFQHEGTLRENMLRHGLLCDTLLFAILRREWKPPASTAS